MDKIFIAPVQGHTDVAWRHFHKMTYGGDNVYYTPFIRCEHGELRQRDLKDFTSELNAGIRVVPQVIFRDIKELEILLDALSQAGAKEVDLNMGCPFPLQTGKGRGAGFIANVEEAAKLPEVLAKYPELKFSAKMRLGYENPQEWRGVINVLNQLNLQHVTMHPRVAKQQYGGELNMKEFEAFRKECKHPVVFNGEIREPMDVARIRETYGENLSVMTARGILGRPSLEAEIRQGSEWPRETRISKMLEFHRRLLSHYEETLCGDSQILSKIKPFWEYAEEEIGRKAWKAIKKATNMAKYHSAVALIS